MLIVVFDCFCFFFVVFFYLAVLFSECSTSCLDNALNEEIIGDYIRSQVNKMKTFRTTTRGKTDETCVRGYNWLNLFVLSVWFCEGKGWALSCWLSTFGYFVTSYCRSVRVVNTRLNYILIAVITKNDGDYVFQQKSNFTPF